MRYSNYLFTKGSIVFVKVPETSENSYLNNRPLIVVSNPIPIMSTLMVCLTGTKNKPGIEVSLYNHYYKKFVGDNKVSKIYPYNIITIRTDQIVSSIGQLDPYIMKEVDVAIDFHLGRTNVVPGYLKSIENTLCGVTYNEMNYNYVIQEMINPGLFGKFIQCAADDVCPVVNDGGTPKYNAPTEWDIAHSMLTPASNSSILTKDSVNQWMKSENSASSDDIKKHCRDSIELVKLLDEKSVAMIVSRLVPVSLISEKYDISKQQAAFLRISLTNVATNMAKLMITSKEVVRSKNPPDYIIIGMLLIKVFSPELIKDYSTEKYDARIFEIAEKYSIDTNSKRTWKSVECFNDI